MKMSESITAIAPALVKAQALIEGAVKDSSNPAFRSKYADLSAVLAVIRQPMADNDLCVIQSPVRADGGVEVETLILHKTGEWISQSCFIPINKWDAHGTGSGITYGRRYGLMAIFCIGTEDDDGNTAVERGPAPPAKKAPAPTFSAPTPPSAQDQAALMGKARAAAQSGMNDFRAFYKALKPSDRDLVQGDFLEEMKELATKADAAKEAE
jgi:hypothetical protein